MIPDLILDPLAWQFWLYLGIVLALAELLVPGVVTIFLGISAGMTAALLALGILQSLASVLIFYFISSILLLMFVRTWVQKFFPSDDSVSETDEIKLTKDQEVEVIDAIPVGGRGRIRLRGVTWDAEFAAGSPQSAQKGETVRIMGQENICWIVYKNAKNEGETQ